MPQLYTVGNPINREERANLNLTLEDIQRRFSIITNNINILTGGQEVEQLINNINTAISNAELSTQNSNEALERLNLQLDNLENQLSILNDLTPVGEWDENNNYLRNNIVNYNFNSYIAVNDNIGINPEDDNVLWRLLASRGEKGETGEGLNILGMLTDPSQLPVDNNNEGDAYLISQGDETFLYIFLNNQFVNTGNIRGPAGSDAQVTLENIQNALGYIPANQEDLNGFLDQYEYQLANVNGSQITINKTSDSNRYLLILENTINNNENISVSVDNGNTFIPLNNFDGTPVTQLEQGLLEIVQRDTFFTLRNRSGGISGEDLDRLITLVNEAETNDSTLRSQYVNTINSINNNTDLNVNSSWNEILLVIANLRNGFQRFKTGAVTVPAGAIEFQYYSNTTNVTQFRATVSDLGFRPSHIILTPNQLTTNSFVTEYYRSLGGYNEYIKQSIGADQSNTSITNRGFKAQSQSAYVNETGFSLPAPVVGEYTYYAYE